MKRVFAFIICVILLCGCGVNETAVTDNSFILKQKTLEEAVSNFLLEDNRNGYLHGECNGEGHLVLGTEEKDSETVVYLLTMYGEYGFTNGKFIKVSGSGVIPAVMKLEKSGNGYKGKSIKYPDDGANYIKSIKEMFPSNYHKAVLTVADSYYDELKEQEVRYAKAYLKIIGRDAEIAEYGDLGTMVLTSYGIPVETSNMLINYPGLENYPFFVGKEEKIENGERYVYEVSVDEETKNITYVKYNYSKQTDIVEKFVFDRNGNIIEEWN